MSQITLSLSVEETNLVLEALGAMPYARVYALVDAVGSQARSQLDRPDGQAAVVPAVRTA